MATLSANGTFLTRCFVGMTFASGIVGHYEKRAAAWDLRCMRDRRQQITDWLKKLGMKA